MPARALLSIVLVLGLAVTVAASAAASVIGQTPARHAAPGQTTALFKILVRADHQLLKVRGLSERKLLKVAERRVKPCADEIARGLGAGLARRAGWGLVDNEAGYEIRFGPLAPERQPSVELLAKAARLKQLFTVKRRRAFMLLRRLDKSESSLNVCADLKSWRAAGWNSKTEPAGLTNRTRKNKALNEVTGFLGSVKFSSTQQATLDALKTRDVKHEMKVTSPVFRSASKWLREQAI